MTSCVQKPNNQAKSLHVETMPFHFGCMKNKALKKYPAGSLTTTAPVCKVAFCVAIFPVFCRIHRGHWAYRHELKLKVGWQAGQLRRRKKREQEEERAECKRFTLAMQLNFHVFKLQAPPLAHFSHFLFARFNETVIPGCNSSCLWKVRTLLEINFTKHIFISSTIKERFKHAIFLQVLS